VARKQLSIIDVFHQEAPFATEFRRLLHKTNVGRQDSKLRSVMITSAMLSEGKSTVAAFLALTAADHKKYRTLLIDADIRKPTVHGYFDLGRDRGLADILGAGLAPQDAIKKTSVDTLDVITAGWLDTNPSEVFDAEAIGLLCEQMQTYYEVVVVDSPPILPVSDPMLLAPKMDGILLVIKAGATQREVVARALNIIGTDRIIGVVLNNVDGKLPYYNNYGYYGYEYRPLGRKQQKSPDSTRTRSSERQDKTGKEKTKDSARDTVGK